MILAYKNCFWLVGKNMAAKRPIWCPVGKTFTPCPPIHPLRKLHHLTLSKSTDETVLFQSMQDLMKTKEPWSSEGETSVLSI